ncbi:MAG TPA: HAD family hydrolase [Treponema sp.]|nr:HAD family hydrolase [Treponema sp.]
MFKDVKAVAFDIDGTLYAQWKLYVRIPFHFLRHLYYYSHYGILRRRLRFMQPVADFYDFQAEQLGKQMHVSKEKAYKLIDSISYKGLQPYFNHIDPFPEAVETIKAFKDAGLKIAILSDFPPSQKGDIWGIRQMCDVCAGSEEYGMLKPSAHSFKELARQLGLEPQQVLYVGNSASYDVRGAASAGMKTAYLLRGLKAVFNKKNPEADISFKTYRQLREIVLQ